MSKLTFLTPARMLFALLVVSVITIVVMNLIGTAPALAAEPPIPKDAPWLNVSRPLTPKDLKGHVVLLDFFTPGCINCIHVLPETDKLEHEFGKRLLVIGVNSPKFKASQKPANVMGFIQRYDIRHPIITDKAMLLWNHYGVYAWPTQVLLGPTGLVIGTYVGENKYAAIRRDVIMTLTSARKAGTLTDKSLPLKPLTYPTQGLLQPGKIAVSPHYIAISDSGHNRIILLNLQGRVIRIIGNGKRGQRNGKALRAEFDGPQGLAFKGGFLYVADTGNALIRAIALSSGKVTTVAGDGEHSFGVVGQYAARGVGLNSPWGLQVVADKLYIAMAGIHQIWRMDFKQDVIGPFAGSGDEGIADGQLDQASFAQSSALAYHNGLLYVADPEASAIRRINLKTRQVTTLIGQGLFAFGLRNGQASQALLQHDQGLAWLDNKLYIADTFNNAIRVLDLQTNRVSTLVTGLFQPGGLAALNNHTLLVADTNANRIVSVDINKRTLKTWSILGLE